MAGCEQGKSPQFQGPGRTDPRPRGGRVSVTNGAVPVVAAIDAVQAGPLALLEAQHMGPRQLPNERMHLTKSTPRLTAVGVAFAGDPQCSTDLSRCGQARRTAHLGL